MSTKLFLLTALVVVLLAIAPAANAQVTNLLRNPSFEEDELILDDPDWSTWTTWNPAEGAGSNAEIDDTESVDGTQSVRVDPLGTANWHFMVLQDQIPLDVGQTYTVSFWAKAAADRPFFAQLKATDNSASWGGTSYDLSTDWTEYTFTSDALSDSAKLELWSAGVEVPVWLDFVHLYAGEYVPGIEPVLTVPFSIGAVEDIELGNDEQTGPDASSNGSGLGARDIPVRRRVFLVSYDISSLMGRGDLAQVNLNHFSHDQHGETNVHGVVEDMDLLEVESLTWNTAPGVQNDPTPELGAPVALDMSDLTDVLLSFAGPGETGIRFSTETSGALADFISSDTDGILTLLFAPAAAGNQLIVRARTHSAGGTLLEGNAAPRANITWVTETQDNDGDGVLDDQGFIDLLTGAGYAVDVQHDRWTALEGQDANDTTDYVAELNTADLVIISRSTASGNYDDGNEPTLWNSVTSPMMLMSNWLLRTSRWSWMNTTDSARSNLSFMEVVDPTHPIFAGVEVDPDGLVEPVDPLAYDEATGFQGLSFVPNTDVGNGTLIGAGLEGYTWIAEWAAGVEFFEGAGQFATANRLAFMAGTENASLGTGVFPYGANTLTAAGTQMYLNAVDYLIPDPPAAFTATLNGGGAGTDSSATGSATFQSNAEGTAISYVLSVTGLENATMAHIHVSDEPGANGGVAVWLYPAGPPPTLIPGSFTGVLGEGDITADSLAGSLAGQSLDALIQAIQENRAYVNIHTEQFGGGEIRGQIE